MKVVTYPATILKKSLSPVTEFNEELKQLVEDMFNIMKTQGGIGLAANQVGIDKRVIVVCVPKAPGEEDRPYNEKPIALVNPEIVDANGKAKYTEGCLSFPGIFETVDRHEKVHVKAFSITGEPMEIQADGLMSICLQHEIDHLNGIVFTDRMSRLKSGVVKKKLAKNLRRK